MRASSAPKLVVAVAAALCLLPVMITYTVLARFAGNQPVFDDYLAILGFAAQLHALPGLPAKLAYIVAAQFSEYKLIFEHTIVALELWATGRVNLLFLCWLGNFSVLGLLPVFSRGLFPQAEDRQVRLLLMVPVCWLLFGLNYGENFDWAMCGLQALPAIVFSAWSLYLLAKADSRAFGASCLLGLLATLSSATGLLVAMAGLPLLIRQKSWHRALLWGVTFGTGLLLYLYGYTRLSYPAVRLSFAARSTALLSLLGGAVENRQHQPVRGASVVLGLCLLGLGVVAAWRKYGRTHPFAEAFWLWTFLSTVPIVLLRADPDLRSQLTGRYKIYSDLLLILAYAYAARRVRIMEDLWSQRRAAALIATTSVLFGGVSDVAGARFLAKRVRETESIAQGRQMSPAARDALDRASASGIYVLPSRLR